MDFLLVEDGPLASRVIASCLHQLGHYVVAVRTGQQAVEWMPRGFDVILMDVCLPDISGLEATRLIREKEKARNYIIGISSFGKDIQDECFLAGFNAVFPKPINIKDMQQIIDKVPYDRRFKTNVDPARGIRSFGSMPSTSGS